LNNELEMILQYYLTYLLERGLNTPRFLREARQRQLGRGEQGNSADF
jgi:hypothetical protein